MPWTHLTFHHERLRSLARSWGERTGMRDGLEVTDDVSGFPAIVMFEQAQSRLHTIKAILLATIGFG